LTIKVSNIERGLELGSELARSWQLNQLQLDVRGGIHIRIVKENAGDREIAHQRSVR